MAAFVDQPVQIQKQRIDLKGNFGISAETVAFYLFDQFEYLGLDAVKGDDIIGKGIIVCRGDIL